MAIIAPIDDSSSGSTDGDDSSGSGPAPATGDDSSATATSDTSASGTSQTGPSHEARFISKSIGGEGGAEQANQEVRTQVAREAGATEEQAQAFGQNPRTVSPETVDTVVGGQQGGGGGGGSSGGRDRAPPAPPAPSGDTNLGLLLLVGVAAVAIGAIVG